MKMFVATTLALAVVASASSPASANLLVNGSFETADFTGWTRSGNLGATVVTPSGSGAYGAEDGNYYLDFGPNKSDGELSQTFADVKGGLLTVSGWLAGDGTGPSDFSVAIDGVIDYQVNTIPSQGYTEFSFTVAATGSDTITLAFRNDPSYDAVDNLVVTEYVPEPGSVAMLAAGLLGLGLTRRRRA